MREVRNCNVLGHPFPNILAMWLVIIEGLPLAGDSSGSIKSWQTQYPHCHSHKCQ